MPVTVRRWPATRSIPVAAWFIANQSEAFNIAALRALADVNWRTIRLGVGHRDFQDLRTLKAVVAVIAAV
jgi:hypothetical protein